MRDPAIRLVAEKAVVIGRFVQKVTVFSQSLAAQFLSCTTAVVQLVNQSC